MIYLYIGEEAENMEKNKSKKEFAYFIEDKSFGKLYVKKSANAWWMDRGKVERLITGCKMDCKPQECRLLAGISKDQLDYFEKIHPEFSAILEDMRKMPSIKARQTIIRALENDSRVAMWYLERKEADEFKERKDIDLVEKPILILDDLFDFSKPKKENQMQEDPNSIDSEPEKKEPELKDQIIEPVEDPNAENSENNKNNEESEEADWMAM